MFALTPYAALLAAVFSSATLAQSSCSALRPSGSIRPSIASGYEYQVVATGLSKPRGIQLDGAGNLLIVESGRGVISAHSLNDKNGCVTVGSSTDITPALNLNHGIELSSDGKTLYGSSATDAYSWAYDSSAKSATGQILLVTNMTTDDHTTRTLLLSQKVPGLLLVTRGSTSNIDFEATTLTSGHSQVKAYSLDNFTGTYDFDTDGLRLGWGLRNDVGIAEHPESGGIYTVENSADQITRMGVDVHQNNPAEELNFLGYLDGTKDAQQGQNFGYPWCFSAWDPSELPDNSSISVGTQFAIDASADSDNQNKTDAYCASQVQSRLVFQAHMAPLDIKFNDTGREAWVTFHGSWDRSQPVGYKMGVVAFNADGQPVDPVTSTTALTDIFANQDNSVCPNNCFRPVGMAIDTQGRIYVSSDASGEVYLITRTTAAAPSASSSSSPTTSPSASSSSSSSGAASSTSSSASASATAKSAAGSLTIPYGYSYQVGDGPGSLFRIGAYFVPLLFMLL